MTGGLRRGLVLGSGGVLGVAWMVGAVHALQDETGLDVRDFDALVGTSAGSILAALLGAGTSAADLVAHQRGGPVESGPLAGFYFDYENASRGDRLVHLRPGIGSRELLLHNARHLYRLPATAVLSALLPEGWGNLGAVGALITHVAPDGWVARDGLSVVALDYDTGTRVAFGRPGAPPAMLADAVLASCAIPGWYHPVRIGEHRYVDGGAWSSTNLDLLTGAGLDEVFVLAPQASFDAGNPSRLATRLERHWRTQVTTRLVREVTRVHAQGTEITVLAPGQEDLQAIGNNPMNVSRRLAVLETSLRTCAPALRDPAELPERSRLRDAG